MTVGEIYWVGVAITLGALMLTAWIQSRCAQARTRQIDALCREAGIDRRTLDELFIREFRNQIR